MRGIVNCFSKIVDFLDLCRIWHLGGFGQMENAPEGHADDLPTILEFSKTSENREVSTFSQQLNFDPNRSSLLTSQSSAQ